MAHYGRNGDSIFDSFSLSPLPYPVLLILALASIFLGISSYINYESAVETAEGQMSWVLFATPVVLILLARWVSSMEVSGLFGSSAWDRRRRTHHLPSEGSSPWAVGAFIVLLLVLLQFQSFFRDSWLV